MDDFIGAVCQCDHSNQNLMVSNNIRSLNVFIGRIIFKLAPFVCF